MYEQLQEEAAALNVVIKETYLPGRLKGIINFVNFSLLYVR
ncbi:hypothetical protein J32TS6_05490 [Virgibacillus pantothenticus]|nr:hypothetical protein [Virgibacillus pantothenticus]GIP61994.1 hypothetical protein J32TS6_05490 [Virgibacillus pantothenticus]